MRSGVIAAVLCLAAALAAPVHSPAQAQRVDIMATQKRYFDFYQRGNYAAALVEARKLEQTVRQLGGTGHENYPIVLEFVGNSLAGVGNFAEADNAYQRVLELRRQLYGDGSTKAADAYNNLGNNKLRQGLYPDAEDYYSRAAAIYRDVKGVNSPELAFVLNNMGVVYENQGKYRDAEKVRKHVLAVYEQSYGTDHPNVADAVTKLGSHYHALGRFSEADALFKRALAIQSRPGLDPVPAARTINNMAILQIDLGRFGEAEAQFRRAIEIEEKALGPDHPVVAEALQNLAATFKAQCRYEEAESLARRVIAIREKTLGPRHPDVASTLVNLGNVLVIDERYADADPLYKRALSIQEQALGRDHPKVAYTLHNLGYAAEAQKRYAEAEEFVRRAIAIREASLGKDHLEIATTLNSLGNALLAQKKYPEAEAAFQRALSIYERSVGANHPNAALTAFNISRLEAARGNTKPALDWSRKSVDALLAAAIASSDESSGQNCLVQQRTAMFANRVARLSDAAKANLEPKPALTSEAFEMAQWANQSGAAQALQQMGARFAAGSDALSALVRESQDLTARARDRDKALVSLMSKPQSQQDSDTIAQIRGDIAEFQRRQAAANARLEKEFPNYAALASPKPMSAKDAQGLLGPDEALIVWIAGEQATDLFAITREAVDWHTLPLGAEALSKKVAAFRKGLDVDLVASGTPEQDKLFDITLAHEFYKDLLGPIEPLLGRKHNLLLVASGALTAVPFQLLVMEPPVLTGAADMSDYRNAAWLAKRNAVTVVPSVASLKSLRLFASKDTAGKPMIGFGDPVFQPDAASPNANPAGGQRSVKQSTKRNEQNAKNPKKTKNAQAPVARAVKTRGYVDFWKGASVDPARLGDVLGQLPDTAVEIKDVALKLGAGPDDIYLGAAATEVAVKNARLADYKVVYFATHGLVAGDVKGLAEPSLVMTLPRKATPEDDGLLTASEVAQLRMNADWVVLSACNTIAGDKPGAEALSGLARSFFYAGARALLVSHWAVASDAATTLTTTAFASLAADPKLGRAEAMRRAMVAYINDTSRPINAYPAFWAPFAVVGEGVLR